MIDSGGKIVVVNAEAEQMFGYRSHELVGRSVDMLVPERLRPEYVRLLRQLDIRSDGHRAGLGRELFGLRKDGGEFPVEIGLNPLRTREGPMVLCVVVNITQRKQMERLKDEFVSTVSHELRTPLTSIAASLGLLSGAAQYDLPATAKRLIAIAHSNSEQLVRLINDILDVEKIESGNVSFDLERIEVVTLVEQTIEASRAFAEGCGVRFRLDASGPHEVRADPDRLMQVVTNLLSNAIKFSSRAALATPDLIRGSSQRDNTIDARAHSASEDARERAVDTRPETGSSARAALATPDLIRGSSQRGNTMDARAGHSPETGSSAHAAEVVVSIVSRDERVRISVRDHGPGIPESFRPHVFERFAQADATAAQPKGGSGLGLSIVKQIVLRLGGEVGFLDAPGGGTIFYVDLPGLEGEGHRDAERRDRYNGARMCRCDDTRAPPAFARTGTA